MKAMDCDVSLKAQATEKCVNGPNSYAWDPDILYT